MSDSALNLQMNRLKLLCEEWARLSSTAASDAHETGVLGDDNNTPINAIVLAAAHGVVGANQRGAAILQFLLKCGIPPHNVALVLSRPSAASPIAEYTATFLTTSPIERVDNIVVPEGTNAAAVTVKVVINRIAADATPTAADLAGLLDAARTQTTQSPSAVGFSELEFKEYGKHSAFVAAIDPAVRDIVTSTSSSTTFVIAKAQRVLNALLIPKYDTDTAMAIRRAAAMYSAVFKTYVHPTLDSAALKAVITAGELRANCGNYLKAANTLPGYDKLADWRAFSNVLEPQIFIKGAIDVGLVATADDQQTITPSEGPVTIRLSARNREQAVLGARTYFFKDTAPANAGDALAFAAAVQSLVWSEVNAAIASKTPTTANDVATRVVAAAALLPNGSVFAPYLVANFGSTIGPVFSDKRGYLAVAETSTLVLRENTSYYIRALLQGVPAAGDNVPASAPASFDVEVGDSIIGGMAEDFPKRAPRTFPEVLLLPDGDPARPMEEMAGAAAAAAGARRAVTRAQIHGNTAMSAEEQRITKQAKLWEEKEREFGSAGPKPKSEDPTNELSTIGRIANGSLQSYASRTAIANANLSMSAEKLFANAPALTVWLPIGGKPVPFHMSTIKEISIRADGASGYICNIVFHTTQESYLAYRNNRTKIFVKELSYRAAETAMFDAVRNAVILGHEAIKDADKRRQAEKGLLPSSGLNVRGQVIAKLPGVYIRPQVYAKIANKGTLEATDKGFRFEFSGGGLSPIEVPFDNVHFCICQPANNDVQVLFHIVLHKPIQWGKEKAGVKEFQVVATVLDASEGVTNRRKMTEQEEIEQEEKDRHRIAATNKEFIDFSKLLTSHIKNIFVPNKSFDIDGSMGKGNVRVRGSAKALWQVNETPFQSVIFSEIEIAMLERMIVGGKTFDLVLVPKNYRNKVVTISSIPMKKADEVKTWLCAGDLVYIEVGTNQNYQRLFKQFETDAEWNPWDRQGWRAMIEGESDEEGEEGSESEDDSWEGSSEEGDESDDSDDSSYAEDSDDFGDSSSGNSQSSGSGSDWSAQEKRLEEQDAENDEDSSDDDRPKKKARTGNAPAAGGRGGMMMGRGGGGRGGAPQRR